MGLNPLVQRVFKGLFDRNKTSFSFAFYARRCSPHCRPVREDGSGSVSAHLVAQVSAVDRRPTDPKFCDAESAGRLRTPLQTSTSTGAQRRGGASWTDYESTYERRTHQVYRASAWRWCKRRTPTAIGVDGVRTVERERARRTVDAAGREDAALWRRGRAATRERSRAVREVLEAAVLAGSGE